MNKITLKLSASDVKILTTVLNHVIVGVSMEELKNDRQDVYLCFSCLMDFYNRLDQKYKDILAFGSLPGKDIKLSLKRSEAIAFFLLFQEDQNNEEDSWLPAVPDSTMILFRTINGHIHQTFFV